MPLLIDLNFHSNNETNDVKEIIKRQAPALAFSKYMENSIRFLKHARINESVNVENIDYTFFKKGNGFFSFPFKTIYYIRKQRPKVVLVQSFIFPFQLLLLRFFLPKEVKIIVQHHGEAPWSGLKLLVQKLAGRSIDAYLFTSADNSIIWKQKGIIRDECPCFELLEASTNFKDLNRREELKNVLGMKGNYNFLWVGRLISTKDPFTIIKAFSKYHKMNPDAQLFMIYQDDTLLPDLVIEINKEGLNLAITLVGEVEHMSLERWYNAADFYISGSHKEACGYALIEAMACGCIPIVTNIPPFNKITDKGNFGILFEIGNPSDLLLKLQKTSLLDQDKFRKRIVNHFESNLSFQSIAKDLDQICNILINQ